MRIAYLDCSSGISGDMTLAALIDAGVDAAAIRRGIDSLGLPGVKLLVEQVMRCAFRATYIRVEHPEQHVHRHLHHIHEILDRASALTARQRELAKRIFRAIAEAEAKVHGTTVEKIHFHEVGAIDSIVDIVGAAIGFDLLGADEVVCSPVPTGRGTVKIAHGVCAVPTPGTAELLRGVPLADVDVEFELTTPTGAAIVKTLAKRFGPLSAMTMDRIGYGAGTRDFPDRANVLRIVVGEAVGGGSSAEERDEVCVLETNLDDVPGEIIGYTRQELFAAGALDVFTAAIQMKKDRPGTLLSVICRPTDQGRMEDIVFRETGTLGIRRQVMHRSKQAWRAADVGTPWGKVAGKMSRFGGRVTFSPEYEACAQLAKQYNVALRDVVRAAEQSFEAQRVELERLFVTREEIKEHDHSHSHDHSHGKDHDHSHSHDHDHSHDHGHDHHH